MSHLAYSLRVQTIKKSIVMASIALPLLVLVLILSRSKAQRVELVYEDQEGSGDNIKIINPTLYSSSSSGNFLKMNAESGVRNRNKNLVFQKITGQLKLPSTLGLAELTSDSCELSANNDHLSLLGGVRLGLDEKYLLVTERIDIDISTKILSGPYPVQVTGESGRIKADTFRIIQESNTLVFEGKVETIIN